MLKYLWPWAHIARLERLLANERAASAKAEKEARETIDRLCGRAI